ncbi:MAG: aminotransferase class I/II-fold pyridoxal phosphate-dependent enzyme [Streptosporangiales bacterium]|nr:aminotransferase class I/II-fold pyridoxal phosphate-dependent enzyme [Streptosporangiales bacterium]
MSRSVPVELAVTLDRAAATALPQQLAGALRDRVRDGELRPGVRLPSTRDLARQLRVSRAVVQAAYDQLHAEGWLLGRVGAGTYVADVGGADTPTRPATPPRQRATAARVVSLRPGVPLAETRPHPTWRRAWREVSASVPPAGYPDPLGLVELRAAVCEYLGRARGVACRPDEVMITTGTSHGWQLLLDAVLTDARRIGVEDPGYRKAVAAVRRAGRELVDVPVDRDGLIVDALPRDGALAAVYTTPAHQFPLGGRLPAGRRYALLDWARRHRSLIIEDDYDSEFRYDVAPLPALAQLDRASVVYLGTASKTLGPALRIGWLVADADVVARLAAFRSEVNDLPAWPVQRALLALFRDGHVDQTVRRVRRTYLDRCRRVCAALAPYGEIVGEDAGLHVNLLLPDAATEARVCAIAATNGVEVDALSDLRRSASGPRGLVVGYGANSDADLDYALATLVAALREGR